MADSDSSTADFRAAAAKFTKSSVRVHAIQIGAHRLAGDLNVAEGSLGEFRRAVLDGVEKQLTHSGIEYTAETLEDRLVSVLAGDEQYLALMTKAQDARTNIVKNDADLERARDERALAMRRMDYVVASLATERVAG